ncbi:MAG: hypothetical protein KAV82_16860 [Phycisphaerae bacterium]|nr:hypothetical protein [Phycisphaerae bacterium]
MRFSRTVPIALVLAVGAMVVVANGYADVGRWPQCTAEESNSFSRGAAGDDFGCSVSISGNVAVVGARNNDYLVNAAGRASVYRFNGSRWVYEQNLYPDPPANSDRFGSSVSIDGDYIVVGAPFDDIEYYDNAGAAYVFHFDGGEWVKQAKLTAFDCGPYGGNGDYFGCSVSISGSYIVIGAYGKSFGDCATGAAYVFKRSGSNWNCQQMIIADDGQNGDLFGHSVGISGSTIVVGTPRDDLDDGYDDQEHGSAYVFCRAGSVWTQEAKLWSSEAGPGDDFGYSVSISGDTIVAGAPGYNYLDIGKAYLYEKPGDGWHNMTGTCKLRRGGSAPNDQFGKSVAITDDIVVVGVWGDDNKGDDSGSACVFKKPTGGWPSSMSRTALLLASDGLAHDRLGKSVGVSSCVIAGVPSYTAVIGAHKAGDDDRGQAYTFHGLSDCNINDTLDICDITNDPSQDYQPNGIPDECEVHLIDSIPQDQSTLCHSTSNGVMLTFDNNITKPDPGDILIRQLLDEGNYGADISANFTFSLEDEFGNPDTTKLIITEDGSVLTDGTWIAVCNTGAWSATDNFILQYAVQVGDVNNNGRVTAADLSPIFGMIPTPDVHPTERCDVNGDGSVTAADLSPVFPKIPSLAVPKPSDH